jgi:hypothetical protein
VQWQSLSLNIEHQCRSFDDPDYVSVRDGGNAASPRLHSYPAKTGNVNHVYVVDETLLTTFDAAVSVGWLTNRVSDLMDRRFVATVPTARGACFGLQA